MEHGYHLRKIQKHPYGTPEKVTEEIEEFKDAMEQGSKIMAAVELSDVYGALEAVASNLGYTMDDLRRMSDITKRAFRNKRR
jgi:alkanesulfonate monooxygenase SsuD/methylene tetrahydromethanopterin reductase-like flavin-dependent oxidoreductase (luciferase family)